MHSILMAFDLKPLLNIPTLLVKVFWMAMFDMQLNDPTLLAKICWVASYTPSNINQYNTIQYNTS